MKVIDALARSIREAARFNAAIEVAPACVLWTDPSGEWRAAIRDLQAQMPELFSFGDYVPAQRSGPAIWLKCVIAGVLPEFPLGERTPVIYLPKVSRADLKAIASCPPAFQPLAELQYRGTFWSQANGRDWTVNAFLVSPKGGLDLDVAKDERTQRAMLSVLEALMQADQADLIGRRLEATDFQRLLTRDPVRDLLLWMSDSEARKQEWQGARWQSFVELCTLSYGLDPDRDGLMAAAEKFCARDGAWADVWQRFLDHPASYPGLPVALDSARPDLAADRSGYPSVNREDEEHLEKALITLRNAPPAEVRATLEALEAEHGVRRSWVWSQLGLSPLAQVLEPLVYLARHTEQPPSGTTPEEMADRYRQHGWQIDDAMLRALALPRAPDQQRLVQDLLHVLYTPWLDQAAQIFQDLVRRKGYPGESGPNDAVGAYDPAGEVVFFVDGLRYDVAQRLFQRMQLLGEAQLKSNWAALPSVTATAKAAVTPVHEAVAGRVTDKEFQPGLKEDDKPFSAHYFRSLMTKAGWQVLAADETGDPNGRAWVQTGDIDGEGHNYGLRLAGRIDSLLEEVEARVAELFEAGWRKVRIVTDHGWLLTPHTMSKVELPRYLTDTRWARCAHLRDGADSAFPKVHWRWNQQVTVAMAPGASAFIAGRHYDHGGLSLQECLTPVIDVRNPVELASKVVASIRSVVWKGLVCRVAVDSEGSGLQVALRERIADAASTLAGPKALQDGKASLLVEDDSREGDSAVVVVLDSTGQVIAKQATLVGDN